MSSRAARAGTHRPLPAAWGMAHQQQVAGFHRERDRGRLLAMARTLVGAGVLVGLVLGVVGVRLHQVRLSYRLDGLRTIRADLEESRSRLRVEIDTLSSLARIEGKARTELGMAPPAANQVQLAREFLSRRESATTTPLTASAGERPRSASGTR